MNLKNVFELSEEKNVDLEKTRILLKFILKSKFNEFDNTSCLSESDEKFLRKSIDELENGKPIQYITHEQYFYGNKFYVDENVLIPQPDTEIVVEETLKQIQNIKKDNLKILDLCTGSGAIAISLLDSTNQNDKITELSIEHYENIDEINKNINMYASDISNEALQVAYKNEENILKKHVIKFIQSNMFENINEKFDIIVSNPPYIKTSVIKTLEKDVQNEPYIALNGGEDGLEFYKIIASKYKKYLKKDGIILLEIGFDQKKELQNLFKESKCIKDFAGNDRVILKKLK